MAVKAVVDGRIVSDPEFKQISENFAVEEFALYSDRRVKNRETDEWESDPKGTTKLKVILKFDALNEWRGKIGKGDIIRVTGTIYEREYDKKDGTKGRALETDYIESIEVIKSNSNSAQTEPEPVW